MEIVKHKNNRGGVRLGAGRKSGSGLYGEETKVIRVPRSSLGDIKKYLNLSRMNNIDEISLAYEETAYNPLVLFEHKVPAGFPSPADEAMDLDLNLHDHLVRNPSHTFCVKAIGESMKDAGIQSGDVMLVDRAIEPEYRSIVLAVIDNEFTVKRVNVSDKKLYLMPENENFTPIEITEDMDFKVWGVVTYVIHKV